MLPSSGEENTYCGGPRFCSVVQQPLTGQDLPITEALRSHSDTPHSIGLLWTSDQPDTEITHNTRKRQASMSLAGFEPAVPASEWPLNLAATGIGTMDPFDGVFPSH